MARTRTLPHTAIGAEGQNLFALCCCYPWAGGARAFSASARDKHLDPKWIKN